AVHQYRQPQGHLADRLTAQPPVYSSAQGQQGHAENQQQDQQVLGVQPELFSPSHADGQGQHHRQGHQVAVEPGQPGRQRLVPRQQIGQQHRCTVAGKPGHPGRPAAAGQQKHHQQRGQPPGQQQTIALQGPQQQGSSKE